MPPKKLQKNSPETSQSHLESSFFDHFCQLDDAGKEGILEKLVQKCSLNSLLFCSNLVKTLLKRDILSLLPIEITCKILQFLDAKSLSRCSCVSKSWLFLASQDFLWHRLCVQHIDTKCTTCGWGLPLIRKKKHTNTLNKWKHTYIDRYIVERNWRVFKFKKFSLDFSRAITSIAYHDSSDVIGVALDDFSLLVFNGNLETLNADAAVVGHTGVITRIQVGPGILVSGGMDASIRFHVNFKLQKHFSFQSPILYFHFSEKILACVMHDKICVVFLDTNERLLFDDVACVCLVSDNLVYVGTRGGGIHVWDLALRRISKRFVGHLDSVTCLQISVPAARKASVLNFSEAPISKLVSGSLDKTVKIWDLYGACLYTCSGHETGILSISIDTLRLVSVCRDRVRLWDMCGTKMYDFVVENVTACVIGDTKLVLAADSKIFVYDFSLKT